MRSRGTAIQLGMRLALSAVVVGTAVSLVYGGFIAAGDTLGKSEQRGDVNMIADKLQGQCDDHMSSGPDPDPQTGIDVQFNNIETLTINSNALEADFSNGEAMEVELRKCDFKMENPNVAKKRDSDTWTFKIESTYDPNANPTSTPSNDPPEVTLSSTN